MYMGLFMDSLRDSPVAACAGYHDIGARVICRVAVADVTAAARAGLTWLGAFVVVVGWMFGDVGCHTTSKGVKVSCELDYIISFWLWILSWKYPHFVEISTFRGYYPHFVEISTFHGYYPHFMYISVFCGYYQHLMEISTFRGYYPHLYRSISHILLI